MAGNSTFPSNNIDISASFGWYARLFYVPNGGEKFLFCLLCLCYYTVLK